MGNLLKSNGGSMFNVLRDVRVNTNTGRIKIDSKSNNATKSAVNGAKRISRNITNTPRRQYQGIELFRELETTSILDSYNSTTIRILLKISVNFLHQRNKCFRFEFCRMKFQAALCKLIISLPSCDLH
jgi:hypothetical protein